MKYFSNVWRNTFLIEGSKLRLLNQKDLPGHDVMLTIFGVQTAVQPFEDLENVVKEGFFVAPADMKEFFDRYGHFIKDDDRVFLVEVIDKMSPKETRFATYYLENGIRFSSDFLGKSLVTHDGEVLMRDDKVAYIESTELRKGNGRLMRCYGYPVGWVPVVEVGAMIFANLTREFRCRRCNIDALRREGIAGELRNFY